MDYELRVFLEILRTGTLTGAARRVHLSQPAVTAAVHRLEEAMGARLLERGATGARPTAAGRALAPWAETVVSALERGRRAVADVQGLAAGEVHLMGGSTVCAVQLPPLLTAFRAAHPGLRLHLREGLSDAIRQRVEAGEVDLGIVSDGVGTEPWRDDPLVLVAAAGVEPTGLPHLTLPPGSNHRGHLDRVFPGAEIAMELTSVAAVRAHAEAGMGVALLSRSAVERELALGRLVEVPAPHTPVPRTLWLVHRGLASLSPAAAALRVALLEHAGAGGGGPPAG